MTAGYSDQSEARIALVNRNKRLEEQVLRALDDLALDTETDGRWLAMARTQIETGFMAANRAIMRPGRVAMDKAGETAWVIERADSRLEAPLYFAPEGRHGSSHWSPDPGMAIRFMREDDAAALAGSLGVQVRVCEHAWS